jgi:hypothetical protein
MGFVISAENPVLLHPLQVDKGREDHRDGCIDSLKANDYVTKDRCLASEEVYYDFSATRWC